MMPYEAGSPSEHCPRRDPATAGLPDGHLVRMWAVDFPAWQLHKKSVGPMPTLRLYPIAVVSICFLNHTCGDLSFEVVNSNVMDKCKTRSCAILVYLSPQFPRFWNSPSACVTLVSPCLTMNPYFHNALILAEFRSCDVITSSLQIPLPYWRGVCVPTSVPKSYICTGVRPPMDMY